MGAALRKLLPSLFPDFREYEHWLIIYHQGKSDLERSYPRKMREWREPGVRFIILRDNDGADCVVLKQKLVSLVPANSPEYLVRIVCQELEGWLLGDMDAVAAAYSRRSQTPELQEVVQNRSGHIDERVRTDAVLDGHASQSWRGRVDRQTHASCEQPVGQFPCVRKRAR